MIQTSLPDYFRQPAQSAEHHHVPPRAEHQGENVPVVKMMPLSARPIISTAKITNRGANRLSCGTACIGTRREN